MNTEQILALIVSGCVLGAATWVVGSFFELTWWVALLVVLASELVYCAVGVAWILWLERDAK